MTFESPRRPICQNRCFLPASSLHSRNALTSPLQRPSKTSWPSPVEAGAARGGLKTSSTAQKLTRTILSPKLGTKMRGLPTERSGQPLSCCLQTENKHRTSTPAKVAICLKRKKTHLRSVSQVWQCSRSRSFQTKDWGAGPNQRGPWTLRKPAPAWQRPWPWHETSPRCSASVHRALGKAA